MPSNLFFEHGLAASAQHNVEFIGEEIERTRFREIKRRDKAIQLAPVFDRRRNRTMIDQRIALEIHLRDQALAKAVAVNRHVNVHRAPIIGAVRPRVGTGAHGEEFVITIIVGDGPTATAKVGVERGKIGVFLMAIAPACVRLPNLDQGMRHGAVVFVQYPTMHQDAFADGRGPRL